MAETYKRLEEEVNLNDFYQSLLDGINEYVNGFKKKYRQDVRDAFNTMYSELYRNPEKFVYSNSENGYGFKNYAGITNNPNKKGFDANGLAAGYIMSKLRKMTTTPKQESSTYNPDSFIITPEMQQRIMGSNPTSWIMLDDYDESTGKRAVTNRVAELIKGLEAEKSRFKFDSEDDNNAARKRIDDLIIILNDGNPNNDWLALEKAGFKDISKYMSTGSESRQAPLTQEEQIVLNNQRRQLDFYSYLRDNGYSGSVLLNPNIGLIDSNDRPLTLKAIKVLLDRINNHSNELLVSSLNTLLSSSINNESKRAYLRLTLNRMNSLGLLHKFSDDSNLYYIEGTNENGAGWVYNDDAKQLQHMNLLEIPYTNNKILNNFFTTYTSVDDIYDPYVVSKYPQIFSNKKGGVLKADEGSKLIQNVEEQRKKLNEIDFLTTNIFTGKPLVSNWYDGLGEYDVNNYIAKYNTNKLLNLDYLKGADRTAWTTSSLSKNDAGRYSVDSKHTINYAKQIEGQDLYKLFTSDLIGADGLLTDMGKEWAKQVDALLPKNADGTLSRATILDENGNVRNSWTTKNSNINGVAGTTYNNVKDYIEWIRNDNALGRAHNGFDKVGDRYFYRSSDGLKHYVDPNVIGQYTVSTTPESISEGNITWNDYELTGLKEQSSPEVKEVDDSKKNESIVISTGDGDSGNNTPTVKNNTSNSSLWDSLGMGLLGAGRLLGSIQTNNKVSKIIDQSLTPKLHNTYELYSPITGAFSEMLLRNRQGAEAMWKASQPFTSDASLASARMFEGLKYANDLQYQGFLADDKEIKRTQAEALKRLEDNIARRTNLANENYDKLIDNKQAKAQLEATRRQKNWNSIDNYLKGIESIFAENFNYKKALQRQIDWDNYTDKRNFDLQLAYKTNATTYQNELDQINDLINTWETNNPNKDFTKQSWYQQVLKRQKELKDRQYYDNMLSLAQQRGWNYTNPYVSNAYAQTDWSTIIKRNGGKLK